MCSVNQMDMAKRRTAKSNSISWSGRVSDDGRHLLLPATWSKEMKSHFVGKRFVMECYEEAPKRTNPQNRYYHGAVVKLTFLELRRHGYDQFMYPVEVHEMWREMFLKRPITDPKTGNVVGYKIGSTTKESVESFWEYINRCRRWSAEVIHLNIPDPPREEDRREYWIQMDRHIEAIQKMTNFTD